MQVASHSQSGKPIGAYRTVAAAFVFEARNGNYEGHHEIQHQLPPKKLVPIDFKSLDSSMDGIPVGLNRLMSSSNAQFRPMGDHLQILTTGDASISWTSTTTLVEPIWDCLKLLPPHFESVLN